MPLKGSELILSALMYTNISAKLGKLPNPQSDAQLKALCEGIAKAICDHIPVAAQVAPGQATAGSPVAQVTTTPGTIM